MSVFQPNPSRIILLFQRRINRYFVFSTKIHNSCRDNQMPLMGDRSVLLLAYAILRFTRNTYYYWHDCHNRHISRIIIAILRILSIDRI